MVIDNPFVPRTNNVGAVRSHLFRRHVRLLILVLVPINWLGMRLVGKVVEHIDVSLLQIWVAQSRVVVGATRAGLCMRPQACILR